MFYIHKYWLDNDRYNKAMEKAAEQDFISPSRAVRLAHHMKAKATVNRAYETMMRSLRAVPNTSIDKIKNAL